MKYHKIIATTLVFCIFALIAFQAHWRYKPIPPDIGTPPIASNHQSTDSTPKLWSILICTLESRKKVFDDIYNKLQQQIKDAGLHNEIELLYSRDNRQFSIGRKRNELLHQSRGKYICFVDDDDDVSDDYIKLVYKRLMQDPDCVALQGIVTFEGEQPKKFVHSIKYDSYFETDDTYYRPPNHLNPMRRSIAIQFTFPTINSGEDTDWAMQICRSDLLKTEETVNSPYYFYLCDRRKPHDTDIINIRRIPGFALCKSMFKYISLHFFS